MGEEDNFEVIEPKDYTQQKDISYSHSALLMSALKRVSENRSKEMRDGYYNTKFDRMGNAHKVWIPDSRAEFIESVESLMMIQGRDFDEQSIESIKLLLDGLEEKYKQYVELEKGEWGILHYQKKQELWNQGTSYREGLLSIDFFPFYRLYLRDKVEAYTKMVSIIQKSIKESGDYQDEIYEA